jgi:hypothetical protein
MGIIKSPPKYESSVPAIELFVIGSEVELAILGSGYIPNDASARRIGVLENFFVLGSKLTSVLGSTPDSLYQTVTSGVIAIS